METLILRIAAKTAWLTCSFSRNCLIFIGEIGFTQYKKSRDVGHQIVIYPKAAHGVVHGRENAHGHLIGVFTGDLVIHIKQVAVAFADLWLSQSFDRICKVQINPKPSRANAASFVTDFLGGA